MGKPLSRGRLAGENSARRFQIGKAKTAHRQIARRSRKDARQRSIETIMDLMSEDESRIGTIYFLMSEENVKKEIAKPWVSFGSDEASQAPEGVFLKSNPHPRAYGNFARVLGKYAREEKVITLPEAVRD